jgi:hypothetical protein
MGKKASEADHFSSKYGGSKIENKLSQDSQGHGTLGCIFVCQGKMIRGFSDLFIGRQSYL